MAWAAPPPFPRLRAVIFPVVGVGDFGWPPWLWDHHGTTPPPSHAIQCPPHFSKPLILRALKGIRGRQICPVKFRIPRPLP